MRKLCFFSGKQCKARGFSAMSVLPSATNIKLWAVWRHQEIVKSNLIVSKNCTFESPGPAVLFHERSYMEWRRYTLKIRSAFSKLKQEDRRVVTNMTYPAHWVSTELQRSDVFNSLRFNRAPTWWRIQLTEGQQSSNAMTSANYTCAHTLTYNRVSVAGATEQLVDVPLIVRNWFP